MSTNKGRVWFPLHCHSHYSLLDGLSKPWQTASRLVEAGLSGSALTDHGSVAGAASWRKATKETCKCSHRKQQHTRAGNACSVRNCKCGCFEKADLKAILGCEFYLCQKDAEIRDPSNRALSHLCVLAKNLQGWKSLVRAVSASNRPDRFYHKPRLDLERLAAFSRGNFLAFSGHPGSDLANVCFADKAKEAWGAADYETARGLVRDDWRTAVPELACKYRDLFGKDNFRLEIQLIDARNLPASLVVARILRWVSKKTGIPCVATADSHYPRTEDARDQRVLLCAALETTLKDVEGRIAAGEDVSLGGFFRSKRYHVPDAGEMAELHEPEELHESLAMADACEDYEILADPLLPEFPCPKGTTPEQLLGRYCEEGFRRMVLDRADEQGIVRTEIADSFDPERSVTVEHSVSEYRERLEGEMKVLVEAGLSSYFLIVRDYCEAARKRGGKIGRGRGSAAGCLVSWLSGITGVDPVVYGLLFERFYNAGRNAPGRIALPDIDVDFEKYRREDVIRYVEGKYGKERVARMATFSRMQGRGALKDVLRARDACSFEEMNRITEFVPDEAAVSDQLREMLEETGEASIIRWALEHEREGLSSWAVLEEDGSVSGPMGDCFEQAMRLEGTFRGMSRHASGVIVSPVDLSEVVPMVHDKSSGEMQVGVDMRDAEALGLVKFDILGTQVLDKIRGAMEIVRTGRLTA